MNIELIQRRVTVFIATAIGAATLLRSFFPEANGHVLLVFSALTGVVLSWRAIRPRD